MSEFINYRAINISPAEIEALIQQHPAVLEVAVVGVPHVIDEEHAMAFIAKVPGKEVIYRWTHHVQRYGNYLHGYHFCPLARVREFSL